MKIAIGLVAFFCGLVVGALAMFRASHRYEVICETKPVAGMYLSTYVKLDRFTGKTWYSVAPHGSSLRWHAVKNSAEDEAKLGTEGKSVNKNDVPTAEEFLGSRNEDGLEIVTRKQDVFDQIEPKTNRTKFTEAEFLPTWDTTTEAVHKVFPHHGVSNSNPYSDLNSTNP